MTITIALIPVWIPVWILVLILAAILVLGLGVAARSALPQPPPVPRCPITTLKYRQVVSLSQPIHPHIPLWPGDPPVRFTPYAQLDREGFYVRQFTLGEHSGTHANAPNSFFADRVAIDQYPPESLVRRAVVVDVRLAAAANPDYALGRTEIEAWERQHGVIAPGSLVLLWTGWQDKWADPVAFLNADAAGRLHFPGFSAAATEFLLAERQIAGLGTDTHGVDPGQDDRLATNRLVLAQGGLVLENLTGLDRLPATGATLVVGLLPLQGGSGSPAAVLAFV